jgi:hypothetical protein
VRKARTHLGAALAVLITIGVALAGVPAQGSKASPMAGPDRSIVATRGPSCPTNALLQTTGTILIGDINEVSGVVASRRTAGMFWIEEDSGNPARLTGVRLNGTELASIAVEGATNLDWEDIAVARGRVWLADIGDNLLIRSSIAVYSFPEPEPSTQRVVADRLTLTYPDGPHNAEALFVDGRRRMLFVVTKVEGTASVYRASIRDVVDGTRRSLRRIATLPLNRVTAADSGPAGIVIKSGEARLYRWSADHRVGPTLAREPCAIPAGPGESIAFSRVPEGLVAIPEGASPTIYLTSVDL